VCVVLIMRVLIMPLACLSVQHRLRARFLQSWWAPTCATAPACRCGVVPCVVRCGASGDSRSARGGGVAVVTVHVVGRHSRPLSASTRVYVGCEREASREHTPGVVPHRLQLPLVCCCHS
jgi:hypothetical protein